MWGPDLAGFKSLKRQQRAFQLPLLLSRSLALSLHRHQRKIMWAHIEKVVSYNASEAPTGHQLYWYSDLRFPSPQSCEKITFCCVSLLVCGILFGSPRKWTQYQPWRCPSDGFPGVQSLVLSPLTLNRADLFYPTKCCRNVGMCFQRQSRKNDCDFHFALSCITCSEGSNP